MRPAGLEPKSDCAGEASSNLLGREKLVVSLSPASKDMITVLEQYAFLEAVTEQRLVKT
jgi:hypothetical protein